MPCPMYVVGGGPAQPGDLSSTPATYVGSSSRSPHASCLMPHPSLCSPPRTAARQAVRRAGRQGTFTCLFCLHCLPCLRRLAHVLEFHVIPMFASNCTPPPPCPPPFTPCDPQSVLRGGICGYLYEGKGLPPRRRPNSLLISSLSRTYLD